MMSLAPFVDALASERQNQPAPAAFEQLDPELLLQKAQMRGHDRLCHPHPLGDAGHALQLADQAEDLEFVQVA
jgi:hypothetical protein